MAHAVDGGNYEQGSGPPPQYERRKPGPPRNPTKLFLWRHTTGKGNSVMIVEEDYERAKAAANLYLKTQAKCLYPDWGTSAYEMTIHYFGEVVTHLPY